MKTTKKATTKKATTKKTTVPVQLKQARNKMATLKEHIVGKTCPICKADLASYDTFQYDHYHCNTCWKDGQGTTVKAMYEKKTNKWIVMRFGIPQTDLHVELWDDNISKIYDHKTRQDVELPTFDIAKCSYEELTKKVKLYVILS